MIDYEVRQVQRWPIRNSPLGALLDPNKDVARFARLIPTGRPDQVGIAVRDPAIRIRHLTLQMVRRLRHRVVSGDSWITTDAQARRTTVHLMNPQYGIGERNHLPLSRPEPAKPPRGLIFPKRFHTMARIDLTSVRAIVIGAGRNRYIPATNCKNPARCVHPSESGAQLEFQQDGMEALPPVASQAPNRLATA
jgi:hypothetical protein